MTHAKVWNFYHDELNVAGKISMKISNNFAFPLDMNNPKDFIAAQRSVDYSMATLLNPTVHGLD